MSSDPWANLQPPPAPPAAMPSQPSAWPAPAPVAPAWPQPPQAAPQPAPKPLTPKTGEILSSYGGDKDKVLLEWQAAKQAMDITKGREMSLRLAVFELLVPNPIEGMNTVALGNGYELKAEHNFNYKLGEKAEVEAALDEIEACGTEGKFIAERLVKWKAEPSVTEYRKLDTESANHRQIKTIIDRVLTIKPGTPALEIKAPKGK
jgi:hypothetical protein